jgi:hypothetical protein
VKAREMPEASVKRNAMLEQWFANYIALCTGDGFGLL